MVNMAARISMWLLFTLEVFLKSRTVRVVVGPTFFSPIIFLRVKKISGQICPGENVKEGGF